MNKKVKTIIACICFCFSLVFASCEMDIDKSSKYSGYCTGTVNTEKLDTKGYYVESLLEKVSIGNGKFTLQIFDNDLPQFILVKNTEGEPVMLFRDLIPEKGVIEINATTTAIALLTFHPVLGSARGDEYNELKDIITSTNHFDEYLYAVEKSIADNRNIYDTTNRQLINAAKAVYAEILGDTSRIFDGDEKRLTYLSELYKCWPIDVSASGSTLNFRLPGCSPSYWCTVTDRSGLIVDKFTLPTRENYSIVSVIKCLLGQSDWWYGKTVSYTFPKPNTQRGFNFDRGNTQGRIDQWLNIASCILSMLGINPVPELIQTVADVVGTAFDEVSSYMESGDLDIMAFVKLGISVVLNKLSDPQSHIFISQKIASQALNIKAALGWINLIEGTGNLLLRVYWNFATETSYSFCSQYNANGSFGLCSTETLEIVSGNFQEGRANRTLSEPLVVYVVSTGDWDELSSKNYLIKFEVEEGCGTVSPASDYMDIQNHCASTKWTLGRKDVQHAYATLLDMDNQMELDKVEFTASVDPRYFAYLNIVGGNNQVGQPNTQLDNPLTVEVKSDPQWDWILSRSYRVQFEPYPNCGTFSNTMVPVNSNHQASSNWTLGDFSNDNEQKTRAILYTEENERIDTVEFSAFMESSVWQASLRCDWASAYVWSHNIDLRQVTNNGIIPIQFQESGYDYDGSHAIFYCSGNYNVYTHQLTLDVDTYDGDGHRTDRFVVNLSGNSVSCGGTLIYMDVDREGCPSVIDFEIISSNSKTMNNHMYNTKDSRYTGCSMSH